MFPSRHENVRVYGQLEDPFPLSRGLNHQWELVQDPPLDRARHKSPPGVRADLFDGRAEYECCILF